ncbi:MAG: imidazoleglycerol-phosphate dehydratase HisB [Syntrophobacterales bacterium]|nr:imidazoleglycerol-phosphate dehydratase HisB [Syntrophobacterales bacterium]
MGKRRAEVVRETRETVIRVSIELDVMDDVLIKTGIGFFDHMLTLMMVHGRLSGYIEASGDIEVDNHHTVEDVGIALGIAFNEALGDRKGINRYGYALIPMDEALSQVVVDLSRRPFLVYKAPPMAERIGSMESELVPEFLRAFAQHGGITLHAHILYGTNSHHMVESLFKALGRALCEASTIGGFYRGVPSTKGTL